MYRLKHLLIRKLVPEWVQQQVCWHPHPKDLILRNHV